MMIVKIIVTDIAKVGDYEISIGYAFYGFHVANMKKLCFHKSNIITLILFPASKLCPRYYYDFLYK